MTKQASVIDNSSEVGRGCVVETRAHPPAIFLRVPGEGKLDKFSRFGPVKKGARMIARTHGMRGFELKHIYLFPV
jgi:hypothetical protein